MRLLAYTKKTPKNPKNMPTPNPIPSEKLLCRKELAASLHVGKTYVNAMIKLGFAPIIPHRFLLDDAIQWLQKHASFRVSDAYRPSLSKPVNKPKHL
jgi:hypothetical protein